MKYTEPRYRKDLDVWVDNSHENSLRVFEALKTFGAPLASDGITPATFTKGRLTYQIGVAPIRVVILTQITGIEFSAAWKRRVPGTVFGVPVPFISLDDLILNKHATGRCSDLQQLEHISKKEQSGT